MRVRTPVFILSVILPLLAADNGFAHQRTSGGPQSGIPIPEISHGEMIVMAENRDRIIDLAGRAIDTDEPFRRVLNYARIQYAYCLWGRMPGGVTDEASPFNECSHAYLAATKAVLLAMRDMPREAAAAGEIVSTVDSAMVLRGLALITCQFSGEAFNTADTIRPDWKAVPGHPASMATLTGLAAVVGAGLFGLRAIGRKGQTSLGSTSNKS
ncbi:hypothetical protein QTL95_09405 [Rhizobium sp. S152]|uniref:hypothetical protein n=1 Tax=Rhizobium sp. S152 TaxID=3055038 RepID=UPI0025AA3008|nr:hypothetical protein [Rhizobium sp. S152]MDM9626113.1 hypothetical protein [Rhizobium sp. S152]